MPRGIEHLQRNGLQELRSRQREAGGEWEWAAGAEGLQTRHESSVVVGFTAELSDVRTEQTKKWAAPLRPHLLWWKQVIAVSGPIWKGSTCQTEHSWYQRAVCGQRNQNKNKKGGSVFLCHNFSVADDRNPLLMMIFHFWKMEGHQSLSLFQTNVALKRAELLNIHQHQDMMKNISYKSLFPYDRVLVPRWE